MKIRNSTKLTFKNFWAKAALEKFILFTIISYSKSKLAKYLLLNNNLIMKSTSIEKLNKC